MSDADLPAIHTNSNADLLHYDVVVIGAGIHGASMASEAASRGLETLVVQGGYLGGASSCVPSDIVGIGLNELENLQLAEVFSNRTELQLMHKKAPHLVRPKLARMLKNSEVRSSRRINFGSSIYNALQPSKANTKQDNALQGSFNADAFEGPAIQEYSINYTRIVIALLQQLENQNGKILARHRLKQAQRQDKRWLLTLQDADTNENRHCTCNVLINCTGSLANNVLKDVLGLHSRTAAQSLYSAQLYVKLPQHWQHVAVLQRPNRSLVYAQNFDHQHLCLGPILADNGDEDSKQAAIEEVLSIWNQQSTTTLSNDDIVFCCWSTHPLVEDPSTEKLDATNTSLLDLNNPGNAAPLLSLFGNSLVRYHKLAEQGLDILQPFTRTPRNKAFRNRPLPGGEFGDQGTLHTLKQLEERYDFLHKEVVERLFYTYGVNALEILKNAHDKSAMGTDFGHGLYQCEVDYLIENEWVQNADDILWRRTYLGLGFSTKSRKDLELYIEKQLAS
ncbi:MAG: FAD-dependent oxidoreductase [Agarilytica sp.]